jgi:hypothetical protein
MVEYTQEETTKKQTQNKTCKYLSAITEIIATIPPEGGP